MQKLRKKYAKYRFIFAGALLLAGIVATPFLRALAYAERGYAAIGGEYAVLLLSIVLALLIVDFFKGDVG